MLGRALFAAGSPNADAPLELARQSLYAAAPAAGMRGLLAFGRKDFAAAHPLLAEALGGGYDTRELRAKLGEALFRLDKNSEAEPKHRAWFSTNGAA